MVTMQKLEWQGMQKSKEPGVNEERTQVWGGGISLWWWKFWTRTREQLSWGRGDGYGSGHGFGLGTMGMVESLEVATLEITLVMEEKEENTGVETWIRQTGVGRWRWS